MNAATGIAHPQAPTRSARRPRTRKNMIAAKGTAKIKIRPPNAFPPASPTASATTIRPPRTRKATAAYRSRLFVQRTITGSRRVGHGSGESRGSPTRYRSPRQAYSSLALHFARCAAGYAATVLAGCATYGQVGTNPAMRIPNVRHRAHISGGTFGTAGDRCAAVRTCRPLSGSGAGHAPFSSSRHGKRRRWRHQVPLVIDSLAGPRRLHATDRRGRRRSSFLHRQSRPAPTGSGGWHLLAAYRAGRSGPDDLCDRADRSAQ